MMRFSLLAIAIGAVISAAPAHAADRASLDCVTAELGAAQVDKMSHVVGDSLVVGVARDDAALAPVVKAVLACKQRNGWSDAASDLARTFALARLSRPSIERALANNGITLATVVAVYHTSRDPRGSQTRA